jgi:hypothetical protein
VALTKTYTQIVHIYTEISGSYGGDYEDLNMMMFFHVVVVVVCSLFNDAFSVSQTI